MPTSLQWLENSSQFGSGLFTSPNSPSVVNIIASLGQPHGLPHISLKHSEDFSNLELLYWLFPLSQMLSTPMIHDYIFHLIYFFVKYLLPFFFYFVLKCVLCVVHVCRHVSVMGTFVREGCMCMDIAIQMESRSCHQVFYLIDNHLIHRGKFSPLSSGLVDWAILDIQLAAGRPRLF